MHCPKCGMLVESADVSFCTRCGFTLAEVRSLMAQGPRHAAEIDVSVGGVNMGIVLMFIGLLPALLAVLTSPIALPAAFLFLALAFGIIQLGSGQILRFFQTGSGPDQDETIRLRRKEIAFGSTLMFLGTILATLVVAGAPDQWAKTALMTLIPATFIGLLVGSGPIYRAYRNIALPAGSKSVGPGKDADQLTGGFATGELAGGASPAALGYKRELAIAERPPSVVEETTRNLGRED